MVLFRRSRIQTRVEVRLEMPRGGGVFHVTEGLCWHVKQAPRSDLARLVPAGNGLLLSSHLGHAKISSIYRWK